MEITFFLKFVFFIPFNFIFHHSYHGCNSQGYCFYYGHRSNTHVISLKLQVSYLFLKAPVVRHFAARLGPAGLSPLVIGEVSNAKEYLNKFTTPPASSSASQSTLVASSSAASTTPPGLGQHGLPGGQNSGMPPAQRTGIGFDPAMLRHECNCTNPVLHPENPR